MHLFRVLATAGAVIAAVPGSRSWEQKPFRKQSGDDDFPLGSDKLPFSTSELEAYIEDVMEKWHAPGVAVAIIRGENTWTQVNQYFNNQYPRKPQ